MDNCHLNAVYAEPREEANYVSNQGRNNSNSFSNPFGQQQFLQWNTAPSQNLYRPPHMQNQNQWPPQNLNERRPNLEETMMQQFAKYDERMKAMETQIATMANLVTQSLTQRAPGALPSQLEANPKNEEVKAIITRSGKQLGEP